MGQTLFSLKHVGIVGSTADGTAMCYRELCRNALHRLGRFQHPEVTIHTWPLHRYIEPIERRDWHVVGNLLSQSARKLAEAGCDFIICPNNTLHRAWDWIESPLPWLHIADVVAEEAVRTRVTRLGLLGTRSLMESNVYGDRLGVRGCEVILPVESDRALLHRIIVEELLLGQYSHPAQSAIHRLIRSLQRRGCEAVILGCTELPLLVRPDIAPVPVLDSTCLLAKAAVHAALAPERRAKAGSSR